ncbi:MAG: hypothetical protein PHV68_04985 [Candidatus Gastranaerophilales bacterium]|nr:hypothetical protein [Candidatus Gastranaerophilales bacterium]
MGKTAEAPTPPSLPDFADSYIKIGNNTIASTYTDDDGNVISQYYQTPEESETYSNINDLINEYLPSLNTLSDKYYDNKELTLQAVKDQSVENLNEIYTPIINELKTDIASRFGSLTNSSFLDELSTIEDARANNVQELNADLILLSNELDDAQLQRNYSFLNLLNTMKSDTITDALNSSTISAGVSDLINNFNLNNYSNDYSYFTELADYIEHKDDDSWLPAYLQ